MHQVEGDVWEQVATKKDLKRSEKSLHDANAKYRSLPGRTLVGMNMSSGSTHPSLGGRWSMRLSVALFVLAAASIVPGISASQNIGGMMSSEDIDGSILHFSDTDAAASNLSRPKAVTSRKLMTSDFPGQIFTSLHEVIGSSDESPTLPEEFLQQQSEMDRLNRDIIRGLRTSAADAEVLSTKTKDLKAMIDESLRDVSGDVKDVNKELSDRINAVVGTDGPPGLPGTNGNAGLNGVPGSDGLEGLQGPPGKVGVSGVQGPPGTEGLRGPPGLMGPQGTHGLAGLYGIGGHQGSPGDEGNTDTWTPAGFFCPEGHSETMRLVDCSAKGCRLEVKFTDEWGTVCSLGVSEKTGSTVCAALGFSSGGKAVKNLGGGEGKIWLSNVQCKGGEGDIGDCPHAPWGKSKCVHGNDLGICCFGGHADGPIGEREGPSELPRCPGVVTEDMRLIDCNLEVCRLEVKHDDVWGSVCDNGFTLTTAKTICKLMGRSDGKFKQMCATQGPFGGCRDNGAGEGPIWLDNLVCIGFERDLEGCRHSPWGTNQCTHEQDVGVCCSGESEDIADPSHCRAGQLDYRFNENLQSSTGGPDLSIPWGGTFAGVKGFRFIEGQGLGVDPSGCILPGAYSIYLQLALDQTIGVRKLFHSNGWGREGLYIRNGHLELLEPNNATISCDENILPDNKYQFVFTRDYTGEVRLYLNGAICASDSSAGADSLRLNAHEVMFLTDTGLNNPSGYVTRIRLFDTALSEDAVAKICKCTPAVKDKQCDLHVEINAALSGIKFSSVKQSTWFLCAGEGQLCSCSGRVRYGSSNQGVWITAPSARSIMCTSQAFGRDPLFGISKVCECKASSEVGKGFAASRLNSEQAWSAAQSAAGEWMQLDTGSLQSIAGLVTQGRRNANEWVTSYTVMVSADANEWVSVGCGRIFSGNSDRNTKVKAWFHEPVKARYVRIYPTAWYGYLSMRAGILVCERPCTNGQLDYEFPLSFMSSTLGPSLVPQWGEGNFQWLDVNGKSLSVYEFEAGQGFELDPVLCLKGTLEWTVLLDVNLDSVDGYKRILGSQGWGDYGLYVNEHLMVVPKDSELECMWTIRSGKFYKFVMSRDSAGLIKLYVNGAFCVQGAPTYKNHFELNPNSITFLHDDAGENVAGYLKNIRIWDRTLDDEEVQSACECSIPDVGNPCLFTAVFNPPSSKMVVSSVWNNDIVGKGYGSGRLGSTSAWSAKFSDLAQFLQIDTEEIQSISGVVTQGRRDADQWVTSYSVQVSKDGSNWKAVSCGMEMAANKDRNSKVKNLFKEPVKARFVRLIPESWHNWISLRAGVLICEKPCKKSELDYEFSGALSSKTYGPSLDPAWGEGDFIEGAGYRFGSGEGLFLDASRCLQDPDAWTMIMRVFLDSVDGYRALMTSYAWDEGNGLYVNDYLQLVPNGTDLTCRDELIRAETWYDFAVTRSKEGRLSLYINGVQCAAGYEPFENAFRLDSTQITFLRDNLGQNTSGNIKKINMWAKELDKYTVASECGCQLAQQIAKSCDHLIDFIALPTRYKFSSVLGDSPLGMGNARGRLNSRGGWQPKTSKIGEWMQIDVGVIQPIVGLVTQGSNDQPSWVTSYDVKVSTDGFEWQDVRCRWSFHGNVDQQTKVRNVFEQPVLGRYIRIYPQKWAGAIGLRAGVFICMQPCSDGQLYFQLGKQTLLSSTDGAGLRTPWGTGYFTSDGYRFRPGQGLQVDENEEGCMQNHVNTTHLESVSTYSVSMTMRLDATTGWARLLASTGWEGEGLYVHGKYQLVSEAGSMACRESILPNKWYQLAITRSSEGKTALFINGAKCAAGIATSTSGFALDPDNITFFRDGGYGNVGGEVKEIHIWNTELSELQVAEYSGCDLNQIAKRCARQITFSVMYAKIKYSSVLDNDGRGEGYGRGRLDSPQAWVSKPVAELTEYMQMDIGGIESLAGIVTQGRRDAAQWVTSYLVHVSDDEVSWVPVFCGEVFDANNDSNTKVTNLFRRPVLARYVRIYPQTWYGQRALRAGVIVCERSCQSGKLVYKLDSSESFLSATNGPALNPYWGEGFFQGQSLGYQFAAGAGFALDESRCISEPKSITILIEVSLGTVNGLQKLLGSESWGDDGFYVDGQYQAYPSAAELKCGEPILPNKFYKYMYSRDASGVVKMYLNGYLCAHGIPSVSMGFLLDPSSIIFLHSNKGWNSAGYLKTIKIWNNTLTDIEAATESECTLADLSAPCNSTVVLIPSYARLKVSSSLGNSPVGSPCSEGRLDAPGGWCSGSNEIGEYLQIDTGEVRTIEGIVTQGMSGKFQWVTSFKVMVSVNGIRYSYVQCGSLFAGNTDMETKVKNVFDVPVFARYVRILPQSWYKWMSMRAGVIVCEKPCKSGQLDYQFLDDLQSTTNGPTLNTPWGSNRFDPLLGYRFNDGRGLLLNEQTCIDGKGAWTIFFQASLDQTNARIQRLVGSEGWGDTGLYILSGKYGILPTSENIACSELLRPDIAYTFIISRSGAGEIKLYLNGYPCARGMASSVNGLALNSTDIEFFHDSVDRSNNAQGYVERIRLWGRVISDKEAAAISGCKHGPISNLSCNSTFVYSAPYSRFTFSSIWNNDPVGFGHGLGRLNSAQAWSAARNGAGEFVEMDLGSSHSVSGVVTQGRLDWSQWVTSVQVTYSNDHRRWYQVQCGETFKANSDGTSLVSIRFDDNIQARFVRIWPITWYNHISMRAGVLLCESPCQGGKLDFTFADTLNSDTEGPALIAEWGEGLFDNSKSKLGYRFGSGQGFKLDATHCVNPNQYSVLFEAQLDQVTTPTLFMKTKPWGDAGLYVKDGSFMLNPSTIGMKCEGLILPGFYYKFGFSRSKEGFVRLYLNGYLCAQKSPEVADNFALSAETVTILHDDRIANSAGYVRRIRMWSEEFTTEEFAMINSCAPAAELTSCTRYVVFNPPYSAIVFSSTWNGDPVGYGHGRGRLDDLQAWSAARYAVGDYMQIDTGSVQKIAGIVTQMRSDWAWQYVSAYSVAVSVDGETWFDVQCGAPFDGNHPASWNDKEVKLKNLFPRPVEGRYVQIIIRAFVGHPSLRAGVLICEKPCQDAKLDYRLNDQLLSSSDGPALEPIGGLGSFTSDGYRYSYGQGLSLDESPCVTDPSTYSIIINAKLDNPNTWNRLLYSPGWDQSGLFVESRSFKLMPVSLGLVCPGIIQPDKVYKFGITHTAGADVKLFLNGWMCASGTTDSAPSGLKLSAGDIEFFKDPKNLNYYGYVSRIRVWGQVLEGPDMTKAMGCRLPKESTQTCPSYVIKNVPYSMMRFDAVYNNYAAGVYYGQGRLNDQYGWLAPDYSQGHWLQMNLGQVRAVAGVVTQGMSWGWYTTSFSVKVSEDGKTWSAVECGRSFSGNSDWYSQIQNMFTRAVQAQFVRIYPETFVGYASMRAGVVVCEDACTGGLLDYAFDGTFESSTEGPSISTPWGMGSFATTLGYQFGSGQGLKIGDSTSCIDNAETYSAILNVRIANSFWSSGTLPSNWIALITSDQWGDSGLYVNGRLMLKPASLTCSEVIRSQYYYQFGITRSAEGIVSLYLNGYPCATGTPASETKLKLSKDLTFMRGTGNQNSGGYVKEIRIWNTELSADAMAAQSGCELLTETAACSGIVSLNIAPDSMAASSVWGGSPMGTYWGSGQLNSQYGWIPSDWTAGKMWLQLDTGKLQSIAGVVTQGCGYYGYYNWYIASFWVEISEDGYDWNYVECGRIFVGNTDWNTQLSTVFAKPVKGRFVRILPESYNGYPTLRAGVLVCESLCTDSELDYPMRDSFTSTTGGPSLKAPWGQGTFQNQFYVFGSGQGLRVDEGACITANSEYSILLKVNLNTVSGWQPLFRSDDWDSNGLYVNTKLQLKGSELICKNEPIRSGVWYTYGISRSKSGTITLYLNGYKCASGIPEENSGFKLELNDLTFLRGSNGQTSSGQVGEIHVWGKTLSSSEMLSESECTLPDSASERCDFQVTLRVPYSQVTASTVYAGYSIGENSYYGQPYLNSPSSWLAYNWDANQWLQLDIGKEGWIAGIATQGSAVWYAWTIQYKVMVSTDASNWFYVECGRIFDANSDMNTVVTNKFDFPVKAQYVRIRPLVWYNYVTMRAALLTCEESCKDGTLDFQMDFSFASSTDGPSLVSTGGTGSFSREQVRSSKGEYIGGTTLYRFSRGQGLYLTEKRCIKQNETYSVILDVWLGTITGWQTLMTAVPWGKAGLFVKDNKFMLKTSTLQCLERIRTSYYYQYGMTRDSDGTVKLYLNGYPCASGSLSKDSDSDLVIEGDGMNFFADSGNSNSGGWVNRIRLWDATLTEKEMAQQSSCNLPGEGNTCSGVIIMNVPYSQITASSIWYGYGISSGWGQVQLDSGGSWAPSYWDQNQWVQLDTGSVQMIAGVVTQGSGNYWGYWAYYVTSFWVTVSTDGSNWKYVECGRIFDTYPDDDYYVAYFKKVINKFTKPVKARYVRILPEGWRNGVMLRAGVLVCETECKHSELNYDMKNSLASISGGPSFSTPWGDGDFSSIYSNWQQTSVSGIVYNFYDNRGGLQLKQSSCLKNKDTFTILLQVQLSSVDISVSSALVTADGWGQNGLFVKGYLGLTPTDIRCSKQFIQTNYYYWYGITRDDDGTITLYINGYPCASGKPTENDGYVLVEDDINFFHGSSKSKTPTGHVQNIRLWNSKLSDEEIQGVTGCTLATPGKSKCSASLSGGLSISAYSASSQGYGGILVTNQYCASPQLDSNYAWCPSTTSAQSWLQMDTGSVQTITGVVTQGYMYGSYWIQTFKVEVSSDEQSWQQVECGRVFIGNTDYNSKVKSYFSSPVQGRYIRILPLTWYNYPFMRADVLVCEQACESGHLDYQMKSMQSATGGPALQAPWGQGSFVPFERDEANDYPWWDIQYYPSASFESCETMCNEDDKCVFVALYKPNGQGCWLKYGFGHDQGQGRRQNWAITMVFHIESLLYKLMAPVGYRFTRGQGLQLDESSCITTSSDYSILIEAMFDDVDGQKKVMTSQGWGSQQGLYVVNRKLTLVPGSGLQCNLNIQPFYAFRFGISRTKAGTMKLYLNGMLCAQGSGDGFKLNSNDITFFYDQSSNSQEQGWVRRIQVWDDALSDMNMAEESGCDQVPQAASCSSTPVLFTAKPSDLDFSSTTNRDEYGTGFGQGQEVSTSQFKTVAEMRAAGKNPPVCPATTAGKVTLQRACWTGGFFATKEGNYNQVRQMCKNNGADLASVTSNDDVNAISNACPGWCYLGLVRDTVQKPWYWVDGSQSSFRNWAGGQPQDSETKTMAWYGSGWHDWGTGESVQPGTCKIGEKGWSSVTGNGVLGTLSLPPGEYSSIDSNGYCDDDAHMCTVQNCGTMSLSELSSLQVPNGLKIILYDQTNFRGASKTYTGPVDIQCLVQDGWNDRARSIRVLKAGESSSLSAVGFWSPQPFRGQGNVWGVGEWMQVDLRKPRNITHVVTSGYQGYYQLSSDDERQGSVPYWQNYNWQVTLFLLRVSNSTMDWLDVDCGRLYNTPWQNTPNAPVTTTFSAPVTARYIRLYPVAWQGGIAMKMQVGVCE